MSLDVYLKEDGTEVWSGNVTHNLNRMANAAGLYWSVWRPGEMNIDRARQMILILRDGLARLESDPERYQKLNPPNGWGSYRSFLAWLHRYLAACIEHPNARISVWR